MRYALALLLCVALNAFAQAKFKNAGVDQFDKLRQQTNAVVLDVRTPKEFAAGHIPGAVNIDWNAADFASKAAALREWADERSVPLSRTLAIGDGANDLEMMAVAGLGVYHSGVEWKLWAGPETCQLALEPLASGPGGLLKQLETVRVIRCDEAPWRFMGLSFAGWNAVLSLLLAIGAFTAARLSWQRA